MRSYDLTKSGGLTYGRSYMHDPLPGITDKDGKSIFPSYLLLFQYTISLCF